MGQLSTHLAGLCLALTRIAQAPGTDSRPQIAYQTLATYLQQHCKIDLALLPKDANPGAIQQLDSVFSALSSEKTAELLACLQQLIAALEASSVPAVVGVELVDIKAQFVKIRDVMVDGSGVRIDHAQVEEGIDIEQIVSAQRTITATAPSSTKPVIELKDVEVGGDLKIGPIFQTIKQFIQGTPADVRALRQRMDMLTLVENIWINGVLRPTQESDSPFQLQVKDRPELIDSQPFAALVQTPAPSDARLGMDGELIASVRQAQPRLLIVGEPGSGKSTLLLRIAQARIAAAREEIVQPIPIVLHLASWSSTFESLQSWILAEMREKYRVPNKTVEPWLANDDLLLLLDGLDEVPEHERPYCLHAINKFLVEHSIGIVVGCRKQEYLALHQRLKFSQAVELQPLSAAQISAQLQAKQLGESPLAQLIRTNENVGELVRTPLGLHILLVAAQNKAAATWQTELSDTQWQAQLFAIYLETMFQRRSGHHPYPPAQTVAWLRWLAHQMVAQRQSIFLMEQMQPSLFTTRVQHLLYQLGLMGAGALLFLLSCPLVVGTIIFMDSLSLAKLLTALALGLLLGGVIAIPLVLTSILARWLHDLVAVGVTLVLLAGLLLVGFKFVFPALAGDNPLLAAVLCTLVFGPLGSLPGIFLSGKRAIQPVNNITWSWYGIRDALLVGVSGSVGLGVLVGLLLGKGDGIGIGFLLGLGCVVPVSLFRMSRRGQIQPAIYPNQGIRHAFYTALIVFAVITLVAVMSGGIWHLVTTTESHRLLLQALTVGMVLGIPIGISAALAAGGATTLQHYLLRAILARSGTVPWKMKDFLDYATDRIFLSRIGGGYIFYHRLLTEYLINSKETPYG